MRCLWRIPKIRDTQPDAPPRGVIPNGDDHIEADDASLKHISGPLTSPPSQSRAEHHRLIELEVATGVVPIPPDERAEIEAEAITIARPVEDIAEDKAWLSHRLLNLRTIISFVLAIGIIIFIFTKLNIDPVKTWNTMLRADPLFFLTGFGIYYAAFWVRAARWRQLLNNVGINQKTERLPGLNGLVEIIYLSWFINTIVPAKLGDAYRSYLLKRNGGISFASTIGTILAERFIDMFVLFGLLSVSFVLIGKHFSEADNNNINLVMLFGAVVVLALILSLVGIRFFSPLILRLIPHRFRDKYTSMQQGMLRSFKRRGLPLLVSFTVIIWLMEAGRLFFITRSLDAHDVTISAAIFIALLSSLITTIPATPGGVGLVEGAVTLCLGLFLKDHQLALSIALLDRLVNYWSIVVGGLVLYFISRRK